MENDVTLESLTSRLHDAGFLAARDEALELMECSSGDVATLDTMVQRRLRGEPLAWIKGFVIFCGHRIRVDPGVYVPRWQSEPLTRRTLARLHAHGVAIDLCTGSGAIAVTLRSERPGARVVASDIDDRAVACARANGVTVYHGDLFEPLPRELEALADVVVSVAPYVPTKSMSLLPRDTFTFESTLSYDGGEDGTQVLRRIVRESPRFLRPGGALLLELGGDEAEILREELARVGFHDVATILDDDGDVRGIEAVAKY